MHGTVVCPACGHTFFSAARGEAPIRCEQCQQPFPPRVAKAHPAIPQVVVPRPTTAHKPAPACSPANIPPDEQSPVVAMLVPEPANSQSVASAPSAPPPHLIPQNLLQASSFQPKPDAKPAPYAFGPPPAPAPSPSSMPLVIGCLSLLGVVLIFCGGGAFLFYRLGAKAIAQAEQEVRQTEEFRVQPPPMRNAPRPPVVPDFSKRSFPNPPPIPTPPHQTIPPDFSPVPPGPIAIPPRMQRPRRPTQLSDGEKLDFILKELGELGKNRPAWFALQELNRLPVMEDRRIEVSLALNRCLLAMDFGTQRAAMEAVQKWGTPENVPALKEVLASPNTQGSREAAQALVKISPNAETAEALIAKLEFGNQGMLRSFFLELGPLAEEPLLAKLETSSKQHDRTYIIQLLGEIGGEASRPLLTRLAEGQDLQLKSMARLALGKIDSRNK